MPKTAVRYEQVVGIRLPTRDVKKLDRLAKVTFRKRADVVRLLLHLAGVREQHDLFLTMPDIPGLPDESHDEEAAGVAG